MFGDTTFMPRSAALFFSIGEKFGLVEQTRKPAIYPNVQWTDAGGLMYYGANIPDLYRRAATYVDKILNKGQAG